MLLLILVLFSSLDLLACLDPPECGQATANKYLGFFYTYNGNVKIKPFLEIKTNGPDDCKNKCRKNDKCYAASFYQNIYCSFYNTIDFNVDTTKQQAVYKWLPCQWEFSIQPSDGRCLGLFVRYKERSIVVSETYLILQQIAATSINKCEAQCLSNPVCEAITFNYDTLNCSLHQLWPHDYVNYTDEIKTDLYKWTCKPGFIETLDPDKIPSQPNTLRCTGYWKVVARNVSLPNSISPGIYFHTQSYNSCLAECDANPACRVALFNVSVTMCVLPFIEPSNQYSYLETLTYIQFEWICLANDSQSEPMTSVEEKYIKMGFQCVKLLNNTNSYIARDNCGNFPAQDKFVNCGKESYPRKWTVTDSCLVGQCFWTIPVPRNLLRIDEKLINNVTKIFTGLTSFWLVLSEFTVLQKVSYLECRRFNGAKALETLPISNFVKRSEWFPFPQLNPFITFERIPANIVLTASQAPYYGCRTKNGCMNILRTLQMLYFRGAGTTNKFDDIPYNFMIDESGHVYEIRGWKNTCQAVKDFNSISLCFAFIGFFKNIHPPVAFLSSVKKLIETAVKLGLVDANYTLYIHQDVTKVSIDRKYAIIIKDWYRYRGFIPSNCLNIDWKTSILNAVVMVAMIVMVIVTSRWLHRYNRCKKCHLVHMCHFRQIFPDNDHTTEWDTNNVGDRNRSTVRCIINEKSCFIQATIDKGYLRLLRLWYGNKFIRSCSSLHVNTGLSSYLRHLTSYGDKMTVYEAYLENYTGSSEDSWHIVFFCSDPTTYRRFERLLTNELCICQYFSIIILSFNHLTFEIVQQ